MKVVHVFTRLSWNYEYYCDVQCDFAQKVVLVERWFVSAPEEHDVYSLRPLNLVRSSGAQCPLLV